MINLDFDWISFDLDINFCFICIVDLTEVLLHQSILFFRCKNQRFQDLVNVLRKRKTKDKWKMRMWRWRMRWLIEESKLFKTSQHENLHNLSAFKWRWRLYITRWWTRTQRLLFIELIHFRAEDEDETESENDRENENENENDEIENKQYRNRLSVDTKINDAKSEDALNRLRFMKLKSWKKTFLSRREVFFFSRCELDDRCCLFWFN
jgi:hypothetical protein